MPLVPRGCSIKFTNAHASTIIEQMSSNFIDQNMKSHYFGSFIQKNVQKVGMNGVFTQLLSILNIKSTKIQTVPVHPKIKGESGQWFFGEKKCCVIFFRKINFHVKTIISSKFVLWSEINQNMCQNTPGILKA